MAIVRDLDAGISSLQLDRGSIPSPAKAEFD